MKKSDLRKT